MKTLAFTQTQGTDVLNSGATRQLVGTLLRALIILELYADVIIKKEAHGDLISLLIILLRIIPGWLPVS